MTQRRAGPGQFVGRVEAMRVLLDAYRQVRSAGRASAVFVSGEAGIGKSRLVAELAAGLDGDPWVLPGHCLEAGDDAPPYAPFVAALRHAVRRLGRDRVIAGLPEGAAADLALLLPGFGPPAPWQEAGRGRLFETVLACFEWLAAERPVVLLIEDAHWADRSTWDLLTFLVRNLDEAPVMLVVTHRDLPYGDPARPLLLDLHRVDGVTAVELPGLSPDEVAAKATDVLGHRPAKSTLDELVRRSGGNPLYVEALLAEPHGGTSALRDLLLLTVERQPEPTQRLLRSIAVAGASVTHDTLAAVSEQDGPTLDDAVRPAVHGGVLVATEDGYAFRHVLIRDAVYDSLLPSERARLHRRYAEALQAGAGSTASRPADLARHWYAAGDPPQAFVAAWRAAEAARSAFAHAERLHMLHRLVQLWPRVPDGEALIGAGRAEVLRDAVEAADESGEPEQGFALAADALAAAESAGRPEVAAQVLERRARIRRRLGRRGAQEDLQQALDMLPADQPSVMRARLLGYLAQRHWVENDNARARAAATEALALAGTVSDEYARLHALITLVGLDVEEGQPERASQYAAIRVAARRIGVPMLEVRTYIEESGLLALLGAYHEAIRTGREGVRRAAQVGLARTLGARVATYLAEPLILVGEWDEALDVIDHVEELDPPAGYRAALLGLRGRVQVARGDTAGAARTVRQVEALLGGEYDTAWELYLQTWLAADVLLAQGAPADAVRAIVRALDTQPAELEPMFAWPVLVLGLRALHQLPANDGARHRLVAVAAGLPARTPYEEAYRASFAVEAAAPADRDAAVAAAVAAWERTGLPHPTAAALLDAAESAAARGERALAADQLARATELGTVLGAEPLLAEAASLARRARITVPAPAAVPEAPSANPYGMTNRELEVLELVALGHTNRQIAGRLFISTKTASVHVSRIITKLGVTNRGQAAALAHRARLFEAQQSAR